MWIGDVREWLGGLREQHAFELLGGEDQQLNRGRQDARMQGCKEGTVLRV